MATQGDKASYTNDIKNWYTVFNSIISTDNFGIATLTVPSSGSKIQATQINALVDKVTEFRNNNYLKTQLSWFPAGSKVTAGVTKITPSNTTFINTVISNASKVKCANTATKTCGTHSSACTSGTKSSGTKGHGSNSDGTLTNQKHWNSHTCSSSCTYGCCVKSCNYGSNNVSTCYYGAYSKTCSCGSVNCNNGDKKNGSNSVTCPNESHSIACSSGTCNCGTKDNTSAIKITCKEIKCSWAG